MKLRRGVDKSARSARRKTGTRDAAAAHEEFADDDSPSRARMRRHAAAGATFDELLAGDFGSLEEGEEGDESVRANAAIVISVSSGRARVFHLDVEKDCLVPPEIATRQKSMLTVGDRVVIEPADGGKWRIRAVLPRRTVLARPDPLNAHLQRLIAANVDVVVNVVSLRSPPLRPRLIDRYLIAIQRGGAQPVIAVNKIDLVPAEERTRELAALAPYASLGVPIIGCSTESGEGIAALRATLEGRTATLVGHSGVGKSSILNALDERLDILTGGLHAKRGTGRHTTTSSTLHDLGGGTFVIDTPGIREFGLSSLNQETLRVYFPELEEASELCRFNDCSHLHEPGCEVKARVESGVIHPARYETYVRLSEDLKEPGR
jgi:ribosome biogenesis GTPase